MFTRGQPEDFAAAIAVAYEVDVVGFLWASLALFEEVDDAVDTAAVYRPRRRDWYSVAAARARILALLADAPEGERFERFLPEVPNDASADKQTQSRVRRGLAWGCTLVASLELAKQGDLTLAQEGLFAPILVSPPGASPSP